MALLINYQTCDSINLDFLSKLTIEQINDFIYGQIGLTLTTNPKPEIGQILYTLGIDKLIEKMTVGDVMSLLFANRRGKGIDNGTGLIESSEFDLSVFFKNITVEDFPTFFVFMLKAGAQEVQGKENTQLSALEWGMSE